MPKTAGVFYSGGEQWISPPWLLFGFVFEHRRKANCVDHNQRMYVCIYTYFQVLIRQCHRTAVGNASCLCYPKWPRESPSGPGDKIIQPVWHEGEKEPSLQACLGSGIRTTSRRGGEGIRKMAGEAPHFWPGRRLSRGFRGLFCKALRWGLEFCTAAITSLPSEAAKRRVFL